MQTNQTKKFDLLKNRTSFKRREQEDGWNGGQGNRLRKKIKESEEFFNHVGLSRFNIYFKIRLCKFLNTFLVLSKGGLDLYVRNRLFYNFFWIFVQEDKS